MKNLIIQKIENHLKSDQIFPTKIDLTCSIKGLTFSINNRDIMGGVIQEWFYQYLDTKGIKWNSPETSQSYPDVILSDGHYLEIKSFHYEGSLAFDIANFKSLIDNLTTNAKRLDSDYIIYAYSVENSGETEKYFLQKYWIKKIWEMTRIPIITKKKTQSPFISAQVKQGTMTNLRPYRFDKNPQEAIKGKKVFLQQLKKTIDHFSVQLIKPKTKFKNSNEWFDLVTKCYERQTGRVLD